jgi:hypothetical protein
MVYRPRCFATIESEPLGAAHVALLGIRLMMLKKCQRPDSTQDQSHRKSARTSTGLASKYGVCCSCVPDPCIQLWLAQWLRNSTPRQRRCWYADGRLSLHIGVWMAACQRLPADGLLKINSRTKPAMT